MNKTNTSSLSSGQLRFDAYCATTTAAMPHELLSCLPDDAGPLSVRNEDIYKFGYTKAMYVENESGKRVMTLLYGKKVHEVFVEVKGQLTHATVKNIRERFKHQVSRVDICIDTCQPGSFARLLRHCLACKKQNPRVRGERHGDWDDHPEDGRTYYLGSKSSICQVCLYKKGKTTPYIAMDLDDWVRLEWRFRPETKAQKVLAATLEPHEMFGLSVVAGRLADMVLADHSFFHMKTLPREKSSPERVFDSMMGQYSKTMWKVSERLGGLDLLLGVIGLRLTGRPWQAFDCSGPDDEQPHFSNKGGPHVPDFDSDSWLESINTHHPESAEEAI